MNENKYEEIKDKVVGGAKELTGKVMDDEEMELKGKLQKGMGKARELAGDVVDEMEDVKDKLVGITKETTGKVTKDKQLEIEGKLQKGKANSPYTDKIIGGIGALIGLLAIKNLFKKRK